MTSRPFDGSVYLADTSAWGRSGQVEVRTEWLGALRSNQIATCPIVMLELLYAARNQADFDTVDERLRALRDIPVTRSVTQAAITALRDLAGTGSGRHRVVAADALIAACAQEAGVGVLHCDRHFDRLAEVMSFESRWLVRPPVRRRR
jgi:predicted nucleic acid-binding protein